MSYSFSVTAESKAEAKEKIGQEFDKVVLSQPVHEVDRAAAEAAANAFVDVLVDPSEQQQIVMSCYGSVGWRAQGEFHSANVSINASVAARA